MTENSCFKNNVSFKVFTNKLMQEMNTNEDVKHCGLYYMRISAMSSPIKMYFNFLGRS